MQLYVAKNDSKTACDPAGNGMYWEQHEEKRHKE